MDLGALDLAQTLSLIASGATILAAVAVALTAGIYYGQLRAMTKARQLESVLKVLEYVDRLDLRRARYFVYQNPHCLSELPNEPFTWDHWKQLDKKIKDLSDQSIGLHEIDLWINALNNIGLLIREGYAPKKILSGHMKNTYLHCGQTFGSYIEHRKHRADVLGEPSMYAQHFEWVVNQLKDNKLAKK